MSTLEIYLFLLTDAFVAGLVLPAKQALVFPAMQIFGGYNLYLAGLISTIAITAAAAINLLLGKMLRSLKKHIPNEEPGEKSKIILLLLKKHGYLAALLGFIPVLGPIITVFTGVVQTSYIRVIAIVFVVNLVSYGIRVVY